MEDQILDTTFEDSRDTDVLPSGTMLCGGKYRIKSKIAQGGFGITYLADMNIGGNITRQVAVKELFLSDGHYRSNDGTTVCTINGKKIDFARWKKKFKRETEVMSSVDDVSIVKVIDYFEENATAYYSMELIDGCNVDSYVPVGGLSELDSIQLIQKVANALNVLHRHNILHLDLNPRNIMRRNDGSVVLIDFGLSKVFDEDHNLKKTVSVTIGGAFPGFAPIEQDDYDGAFTPTIDIYALGANFYKMLTGEKPPKPTKLMKGLQVLKDKMKSKGVCNQTIEIVAKAMQFDPENRYQTVDEFLSALGQVSNTDNQNKQSDNTQRATSARTQASSSYSNGATRVVVKKNVKITKGTVNTDEQPKSVGRWVYDIFGYLLSIPAWLILILSGFSIVCIFVGEGWARIIPLLCAISCWVTFSKNTFVKVCGVLFNIGIFLLLMNINLKSKEAALPIACFATLYTQLVVIIWPKHSEKVFDIFSR